MKYYLCWLAHVPVDDLKPLVDVDEVLLRANQGSEYDLAKLVRINWMIPHIKQHGIIKPIWCRDGFEVIVGDTRVIAARLAGILTVPVLAYLLNPQGEVCQSLEHLLDLSGFDINTKVLFHGSDDLINQPPEWVEIAAAGTAGHGHDQGRRLRAIQQMLLSNPQQLTKEWLLDPKDWGDLFH